MTSENAHEGPLPPRLTLRVGITGKRAIPEGERARICKSLSDVFAALADIVAERQAKAPDFFAKQRPLLRIISGMAEGADQLAAYAAIARFEQGHAVETRLAAILPFAKTEYEKDFKKEPLTSGARERSKDEWTREVARFEELLDNPAVESVLQIDDEALRSDERKIRDQAYTNLRDVLLEHTDVLVAVSNDEYGGAGGTVNVIAIAASLNIPVIKISTLKKEVYVMRPAELDAPDQTPQEDDKQEIKPGAGLPDGIADQIRRMLDPPESPSPDPAESSGQHESEARPVREQLDKFFGEDIKTKRPAFVFKALRAALIDPWKPRALLCFRLIGAFVMGRKDYLRGLRMPRSAAARSAARLWPSRYRSFSDDRGTQARAVLAWRYGWADTMAVRYADLTRSAHIMIAFLGAIAVMTALATLVMWEEPGWLALVIKIVALIVEVIVLLAAGRRYFRPAHKERWHERMVEYRAVAELLRHERFIYALGAADRPGRAADRTFEEPDAWVGWYVRATLRELGFPRKALSQGARCKVLRTFLDEELDGRNGQIDYNRGQAHRFHMIDRRLENFVRFAFWFTVTVAVVGILALSTLGYMVWCEPGGHEGADHAIHMIKPWFTVIAALVPAVIAAVHGIRFQIEFKGTALRSAATMRELEKVREEVEKELKKEFPAPGRKQSIRLVRTANEAMSADVAGWSNFYRGRGPELG